jgi:two-component system, NarL family, sensor histidine kinase DesK
MNSHELQARGPESQILYEMPRWAHFIWLIYLGFLFVPLLVNGNDWRWFWPTVLSLPVFLLMYARIIRAFRRCHPPGIAILPELCTIAALGYTLTLVNDSANTYLIYCAAVTPFMVSGFRRVLLVIALLMGIYALELSLHGFRSLLFCMTLVIGIAAATSNYMMLRNRLHNLALRRASEELHRMERVAERERISRDLHDLLGHTLSLIAIKSELAAKLLDRDRTAASREVVDVMNIARDALKQVRTAVTGIRAAALEGELASARALLETADVALTFERDGVVLPAEVESALAMIVREAVTNIQRHAGARSARIEVLSDEGFAERGVLLRVSDDGCGGITDQGNGLAGIRERVESLAGSLEIESPPGKGTVLRARIPLVAPAGTAAVGAALKDASTGSAVAGASRATAEVVSAQETRAIAGRRDGTTAGLPGGTPIGRPEAAPLKSETPDLGPTPSVVGT